MRVLLLAIIASTVLLLACQSLQDNVEMNKELFLAKTECFANVEAVEEARMAVSTQGPHNDTMYQILNVQVKLKEGSSHTEMPDPASAIECLRPILNKYPKLTHLGIQYKDDRSEDRSGLEAFDVLVSK